MSAFSKIIGIDPGLNGAIAVIDANSGELISCVNMPQTPRDIYDYLRGIEDAICYMEDVGKGMPGQSSKATATFARHNGHLEMALASCGISHIMVTPLKWQKYFNLSSKKGEVKNDHKNRIKAYAQRRFADAMVTLVNADALVIALYGFEKGGRV